MKKKIQINDLRFIKDKNKFLKKKLDDLKLYYRELKDDEYQEYIFKILHEVFVKKLTVSGSNRKKVWEDGWEENNKLLNRNKSYSSIIPKYFLKYKALRLNNRLIKPLSKNFELKIFHYLQYYYFNKYLKGIQYIYEFGCGTGQNLKNIRNVNKESDIIGLDWSKSSGKIINKYFKNDHKINYKEFNFFKPDNKFKLYKQSGIVTIAALEQTGKNYKKFINYILKQKPKICIHIEPINELMDQNNMLDLLSVLYSRKRNYLDNFLTYLKLIQKNNQIKIIKNERTYLGSLFIEGYSVVVWKPI